MDTAFMALVRQHQWAGYNTDVGERCCWCCGAWSYQGDGVEPTHQYACALATYLGEPMVPGVMDKDDGP